ncbi:MAG: HEAT repeat domain-containing protein [bacterium]
MVQLQSAERRRFPRAPVTTPVEFQSELGLETAVASDLGAGGMRVSTRTALTLGSDVWIKFKPPATLRPMFFQARVVRLGPDTQNPGEHEGFAVGFVDPTGSATDELDRLVRRYLTANGLDATVPPAAPTPSAEAETDGPKSVAIRYRTEREFIDAYVQQLCDARIELRASQAWPVGTRVEVEIELPNYYEILRLDTVIESSLGAVTAGPRSGAPSDFLHRARVLEPTSEAMRFVHGFASVFLSARPGPRTQAEPEAHADAASLAMPEPARAAEPATPAPEPLNAALAAAVAEPRPTEGEGTADLTALIAEALSALDAHAVDEWKAPPREPAVAAAPAAESPANRETKRIENIADLVARSLHGASAERPRPSPQTERELGARSPASPSAVRAAEARLRVSGKSASEWAGLLGDDDPDQRAAAASALGKLGSTAAFAVNALAAALNDVDPRVRRAAAWALGDIGHGASEAVPALTDRLADADARVRWRAVRALRAIGPAASLAVPELSRALTDEDDRVRQWAETALHDLASIGADASLSPSSV